MINQAEQDAIAATDYFALFERPRHLVLDTATLEKDFYRLSRQWHPDRFARAASDEKQRSLEMTSQLNDAYRTLKDPIARTEYLLTIEGKPIERDKNADAKQIPVDLLEEVFELNMQLEEMRAGSDDPEIRADLERARTNFEAQLEGADSELQGLWQQWDKASDAPDVTTKAKTLDAMVALLHRRQYIANLVRDVRAALGAE
jgi:molecular chaperone HscB